MRRRKRNWLLLILFIIFFAGLIYLIVKLPPGQNLTIYKFPLSPIILFFFGTFLSFFTLISFIFKSFLQGFLVSLVLVIFFLFRFFQLTNIFFLVLLLIIFVVLEFAFVRKN